MKIRTAIGLAAVILVLKFLVPKMFASFEGMTIALFDTLHDLFVASSARLPPPR